jgi:hypothetical protein
VSGLFSFCRINFSPFLPDLMLQITACGPLSQPRKFSGTVNDAPSPLPEARVGGPDYRIDADHSNAYEAWKELHSPFPISAKQYAQLEQAGHLAELNPPATINVQAGVAEVKFTLPRQGVSLLLLTWD